MNGAYREIIAASDADRRDLFIGTANRLGTAVQNVEKDFWVCWVLDALFNGLPAHGPRLLFKGGTSLSKGFGLISRFSEDIDITVFRDDLGQPAEPAELEALSGKKRRQRLDAIREACQLFIQGDFEAGLRTRAVDFIQKGFTLESDPDDADGQSLLLWYPTAVAQADGYVRSAVKIESGAKSALDPHTAVTVRPYIADDLPHMELGVSNVTTVQPERTLWDKIVILHGLRQWYDRRGELRHGGQRVSRHYYDVYQLLRSPHTARWLANGSLAEDCARHARLFFGSSDLGLDAAAHGTFTLMPSAAMLDALRRDYSAMAGMIFHDVPDLRDVLASVEQLENDINIR
ncbi:nucleotidyl transferase AbiEii/AbiGii toxin family protein [Paraburkholderia bannensis]|uniref:nucleotidyl transferase AbiEii/AbiGii toxin family protein n=1 Tax=Paraburkholderia bannensis TaxID=765414 RepID=UPI002AB64C4F|nr:nucleotidyl transferase AbiEii/AbiGii toxin family protein [Paraburkholderia bannensis]